MIYFDGGGKSDGIKAEVRALSPELIVYDEIGSDLDAEAILSAVNCGVSFAASVYADGAGGIARKKGVLSLLSAGAFKKIVLLDKAGGIFRIEDIKDVMENDEICGSGIRICGVHGCGNADGVTPCGSGRDAAPVHFAYGNTDGGNRVRHGAAV